MIIENETSQTGHGKRPGPTEAIVDPVLVAPSGGLYCDPVSEHVEF